MKKLVAAFALTVSVVASTGARAEVRGTLAEAKAPEGSVEYPMINPVSGKMEVKTSFYSRLADDLLCGVGAFSGH